MYCHGSVDPAITPMPVPVSVSDTFAGRRSQELLRSLRAYTMEFSGCFVRLL